MHTHYETTFILSPVLSDSENKLFLDKFKKTIEGAGGKLIHQDKWGSRALAYPIKKHKNGYYVVTEIEMPPQSLEVLTVFFRREEHVLRHLTVKLDKHGIAYLAKARAENKHRPTSEENKKEKDSK